MGKIVLVTGAAGYIGSWVVKKLLEKGYTVRATVRDKNKKEKYGFLEDISERSKGVLEIYEADLLQEGSFDKAVNGSEAIIHVASPFTLKFKDPVNELINPAVKGTRNVLYAANRSDSVKKVVLTSSVAAIHGDNRDMKDLGIDEFTEEYFNETSSEKHQAYSYSKVLAEKEAWKIHEKQNKWELIVINPSFVMGPPLTDHSVSGSIVLMKELLGGKYFLGVPELNLGYVDVRDIAQAHILALENKDAHGRYIISERIESMKGLSDIIEKLYPKKFKLPMMKTPKLMVLLVGWAFGQKFKFVLNNVGYPLKLNNKKSIKELGMKYIPLETTIADMIARMEESGMIKGKKD